MFRTRFLCLSGAALAALAVAAPALGDVKITDRHTSATTAARTRPSPPARRTTGSRTSRPPRSTPSQPHEDDGRRKRLLPGADGRRLVGGLLLQLGRRCHLDEQPAARLSDRHLDRGPASPLFGLVGSAGDPVQAWDRFGNVYYGGIAFNRARPASGSIWVARYSWVAGSVPDYQGTTLVERGTPSPIFLGHFNDKVMIEVDRSTNAATSGNVYVCWALFTASGPEQRRLLLPLDRRRPHVLEPDEALRQRARQPVVRHRRRQHGPRVGRLAPVRVQGEQGSAAARRDRVRLLDGRRPLVHEAGGRAPSSPTGTWATRPAIRRRTARRATRPVSSATARSAAARARTRG